MREFPRSDIRNTPAVLLLIVTLGGCSLWHEVGKDDLQGFLEREKPQTVRVSLAESTVVLTQPIVLRDSLTGTVRETRPPQHAAISTADIRRVDARSRNGPKALRLSLGAIGAAALAIAAIAIIAPHPMSIP